MNSNTAYTQDGDPSAQIQFQEIQSNQDFRAKICLPYFKDIYKDLQERSDNPAKGINKISLLDYSQLPGVLGDRFFTVLDADGNGYIDQQEFVSGLFRVFCSSFDEKADFVFEIYDFDGDGFITKNDIATILASLPVINYHKRSEQTEGKFTQEGGGLDNFEQRVETMDEMNQILDLCFGGRTRIDPPTFREINETVSSDTVLAVLGLFRERLPCSENFWRYKRNYDLHTKALKNKETIPTAATSDGGQQAAAAGMKRLASPKMRHVRALSPYANARGTEEGPDASKMSFLRMAAGLNPDGNKTGGPD